MSRTGCETHVVSEMRSASVRHRKITADVSWDEGRGGSMDAGFIGPSPDDLTEV